MGRTKKLDRQRQAEVLKKDYLYRERVKETDRETGRKIEDIKLIFKAS